LLFLDARHFYRELHHALPTTLILPYWSFTMISITRILKEMALFSPLDRRKRRQIGGKISLNAIRS
jgi:hypothetical protein